MSPPSRQRLTAVSGSRHEPAVEPARRGSATAPPGPPSRMRYAVRAKRPGPLNALPQARKAGKRLSVLHFRLGSEKLQRSWKRIRTADGGSSCPLSRKAGTGTLPRDSRVSEASAARGKRQCEERAPSSSRNRRLSGFLATWRRWPSHERVSGPTCALQLWQHELMRGVVVAPRCSSSRLNILTGVQQFGVPLAIAGTRTRWPITTRLPFCIKLLRSR